MNSAAPLAIDLFCGLGGWSEGLIAEGWRVVGFDIERHAYGSDKYPGQLVLQDVLTIHGSQFKSASLIVASPPCQEYSYMAMPWSRAKNIAAEYRSGVRDVKKLTALFDACFRIQREACAAAGRHIPMVVENVRGAQPWVGKARANYGSFYLWGDVPALMPVPHKAIKVPGFRFDGSGGSFQTAAVEGVKVATGASWRHPSDPRHIPGLAFNTLADRATKNKAGADGVKHAGDWFSDPASPSRQGGLIKAKEGTKQAGISGPRENGKGNAWFQDGAARHGSKSTARKAASARIAKIPLRLGRHIAAFYRPEMAA